MVNMEEDQNKIDVSTGILPTPSYHGENCFGNGEHPGLECCCDECDFYLACFPDWETYVAQFYANLL